MQPPRLVGEIRDRALDVGEQFRVRRRLQIERLAKPPLHLGGEARHVTFPAGHGTLIDPREGGEIFLPQATSSAPFPEIVHTGD